MSDKSALVALVAVLALLLGALVWAHKASAARCESRGGQYIITDKCDSFCLERSPRHTGDGTGRALAGAR